MKKKTLLHELHFTNGKTNELRKNNVTTTHEKFTN